MKPSFYKGIVLGAAVAILVLVASTAVAGTGIGGIFNLGQTNTVNATSALSGASVGAQLQVTNSGIGSGAQGIGAFNNSVAAALYGRNSGGGAGVSGRSDKRGNGVEGVSAGAGASGVYGANTSTNGFGVAGRSTGAAGIGVFGNNTAGGLGVSGKSTTGNGAQGATAGSGSSGVYGENTSTGSGYGVAGRSMGSNGIGVYGDNSAGGWAGYFTAKLHLGGALDCAGCVGASDLTQSYYQTGSKVDDSSHADNADTVGGQSASALQTHAYHKHWLWFDGPTYAVPANNAPVAPVISLTLPPGTYVISANASFKNSASYPGDNWRSIECVVQPDYGSPVWLQHGDGAFLAMQPGGDNSSGAIAQTRVVSTSASQPTVGFQCGARTGRTDTSSVTGISADITAVKVDQLN
jgi:hypothetical protein